jgi:hypothetical protein
MLPVLLQERRKSRRKPGRSVITEDQEVERKKKFTFPPLLCRRPMNLLLEPRYITSQKKQNRGKVLRIQWELTATLGLDTGESGHVASASRGRNPNLQARLLEGRVERDRRHCGSHQDIKKLSTYARVLIKLRVM